MDWVPGHVPGGKENFNACSIKVDSFSKSVRFLPCQKEDTAMDTALFSFGMTQYPPVESLRLSLVTGTQNSHQILGTTSMTFLALNLLFLQLAIHKQID
ncbi:hypothetical protein O181_033781 [Austropuccinia psidii MF-1]|uniref:Uncharacterized protein n=1 Tax=Austropuccinia psidii MF-1 TaxID=1389203 RepID=A0A9Q3H7E5_9BASI|nr:hypothetical protein [Austropuccinia psidii MF-1]